MTDANQIARGIIGRWRPYMKVFGPTKGFPKNKGSMQDDITAALLEYGEAVKKEQLIKLFPVNADDLRDATLDKLLKEADAAGYRRGVEESEKVGMEAVLKTSCVKDSHCQSVAEVYAQAIKKLQRGQEGPKLRELCGKEDLRDIAAEAEGGCVPPV